MARQRLECARIPPLLTRHFAQQPAPRSAGIGKRRNASHSTRFATSARLGQIWPPLTVNYHFSIVSKRMNCTSEELANHIAGSIEKSRFVEKPFYHLEFDRVFPEDLYARMVQLMPGSDDYR